jgi:xylan 1,4-beta-xylosidase
VRWPSSLVRTPETAQAIFEENGPPSTPFHGGFGLLTFQGFKKPAYFAYEFLNRLDTAELENADDASWVRRDDHGGVQILLWSLTPPYWRQSF